MDYLGKKILFKVKAYWCCIKILSPSKYHLCVTLSPTKRTQIGRGSFRKLPYEWYCEILS